MCRDGRYMETCQHRRPSYLRVLLYVVPVVLFVVVVVAQIEVVNLFAGLFCLIAKRILRHQDFCDEFLDVRFTELHIIQRDADVVRRGLPLPSG